MATEIFPQLPLELILRVLWLSSKLGSTEHARNVCCVSRAAYEQCWPNLWRIVCLRNAGQLKRFADTIFVPGITARSLRCPDERVEQVGLNRQLRRKQDAVEAVYVNNNKDVHGLRALNTRERPEMWMISIMMSARNLRIFHVEEYWSMSYPWDTLEEKPLIAYPLMLLSRFAVAIEAALLAAPDTEWSQRFLRGTTVKDVGNTDVYEAIMQLQRTETLRRAPQDLAAQPQEITLSALAMLPAHLLRPHDASGGDLNLAGGEAFDRLTHLHLYFAKLDKRLIDAIAQLPSLTHIRFTRPFSEMLTGGVRTLLEMGRPDLGHAPKPALQSLVIEAGLYMDRRTVEEMGVMVSAPGNRHRLTFMTSNLNQAPYTVRNRSNSEGVGEGSADRGSTGQVLDYVTSSEQRGFSDFVARAQGLDGVWQLA